MATWNNQLASLTGGPQFDFAGRNYLAGNPIQGPLVSEIGGGTITNQQSQTVQAPQPTPITTTPVDSLVQQQQNGINSGYNLYFQQLDSMFSGLDAQRQAQEQIVGNTFQQGISDLNATFNQGKADLSTQERKTAENSKKTLTNLADNLRNQLQAGQVYLGARGAGDSSASNQYSYAVTKLGNQNRANVLAQTNSIYSDINDRASRLQNIYTQESSRLQTEKANQIAQIASWFADAQNQIKSMRATGELSKQQDLNALSGQILNNALAQVNQINSRTSNLGATLQAWANTQSQNIKLAQQQSQGQSNYSAPNIYNPPINGYPVFNSSTSQTPIGYGLNNSSDWFDQYKNPFA